jgi:hypothetical protein
MKLVAVFFAILFASVLAFPSLASADEVLHPPSGPVYVSHQVESPTPERREKTERLRRAMREQFDVNGDGRLGPRERMRAVRMLERLQRKLARQPGAEGQPKKMRRIIDRFDTNHDGNVDRREMPPGAARRLRRLDRDRDGWIEPSEQR